METKAAKLKGMVVCIPTYGRKYNTPIEIINDLKAGKDFILRDQTLPTDWYEKHFSIRDCEENCRIKVYYGKQHENCAYYSVEADVLEVFKQKGGGKLNADLL